MNTYSVVQRQYPSSVTLIAHIFYLFYSWFIKNIQFGCQRQNYIEFTKFTEIDIKQ